MTSRTFDLVDQCLNVSSRRLCLVVTNPGEIRNNNLTDCCGDVLKALCIYNHDPIDAAVEVAFIGCL